jgi:hypothetical protein
MQIDDVARDNPDVDKDEVATAVNLVESLRRLGVERHRYNLASPTDSRTYHAVREGNCS